MKRRNFFRNGLLGIGGLLFGRKAVKERTGLPITNNEPLTDNGKTIVNSDYLVPCTWNPRGEFDVSKAMTERI